MSDSHETDTESQDNLRDHAADETILNCLRNDPPQSFQLFAGAGSGKTRSLANLLKKGVADNPDFKHRLRLQGRKVAVITFTNAARDEIIRRVEADPAIVVSTNHSFTWSLIQGLNHDIRTWLERKLQAKLVELEGKQRKGRVGSKAQTVIRPRQIASTTSRLEQLPKITCFTYSPEPDADNSGRDALQHAEVMAMCADFLQEKTLMREMLINRFPILLMDECQDANKALIEALLETQKNCADRFTLGLIGDAMQRIYFDGYENLSERIAQIGGWKTPKKVMNHRSPQRLVTLTNAIRKGGDGIEQEWRRSRRDVGHVRLFILPGNEADYQELEARVRQHMAQETMDLLWREPSQVKGLILEHHMAATRLGFANFFLPLYEAYPSEKRGGLLKGTQPEITFLTRQLCPIIRAHQNNQGRRLMALLKKHSPLLSSDQLQMAQQDPLMAVRQAMHDFMGQFIDLKQAPTLKTLIQTADRINLLNPPALLLDAADFTPGISGQEDEELTGWSKALASDIGQVELYDTYVHGQAGFDTHQGVKGLEFQRVMTILDDHNTRGWTFKYEKSLLGQGTGTDQTLRLFYVICSRAQRSLAVVLYTKEKAQAVQQVMVEQRKWFAEQEIIVLE